MKLAHTARRLTTTVTASPSSHHLSTTTTLRSPFLHVPILVRGRIRPKAHRKSTTCPSSRVSGEGRWTLSCFAAAQLQSRLILQCGRPASVRHAALRRQQMLTHAMCAILRNVRCAYHDLFEVCVTVFNSQFKASAKCDTCRTESTLGVVSGGLARSSVARVQAACRLDPSR